MKNKNWAYCLIFLMLCILPFFAVLMGLGPTNETFEKRKLAEKPDIFQIPLAEFPHQYETYFNDTIPFRHELITWNNRLNYFLQSASSTGNLIQGKDSWLFYNPAGTDGDPVGDYYGTVPYSVELMQNTAEHLNQIQSSLAQRGCEFLVFIIPNKECIYGTAFFPTHYPRSNRPSSADAWAEYLSQNAAVPVIYAKPVIQAAMEAYPQYLYYYKQDTHWNDLGAYLGSRQVLEALGISIPPIEDVELSETTEDSSTDLSQLITMDNICLETHYTLSYTGKQPVQRESWDGNEIEGIIRTHSQNGDSRKLMVVRDSFAMAMINDLGSAFSDCIFVHRQDYTPELLEYEEPDILIYECVERYLAFLPAFQIA